MYAVWCSVRPHYAHTPHTLAHHPLHEVNRCAPSTAFLIARVLPLPPAMRMISCEVWVRAIRAALCN